MSARFSAGSDQPPHLYRRIHQRMWNKASELPEGHRALVTQDVAPTSRAFSLKRSAERAQGTRSVARRLVSTTSPKGPIT